jgi:hypothetical protein
MTPKSKDEQSRIVHRRQGSSPQFRQAYGLTAGAVGHTVPGSIYSIIECE